MLVSAFAICSFSDAVAVYNTDNQLLILQRSSTMQDLQESALFKELKGSAPFFLMAGPNVIQSEAHCLKMCRQIKARLPLPKQLHV